MVRVHYHPPPFVKTSGGRPKIQASKVSVEFLSILADKVIRAIDNIFTKNNETNVIIFIKTYAGI